MSFHNAVGDVMPDAVTAANPQILKPLGRVGVITAIGDQHPNGIQFALVKCSFKLTDVIDTDELFSPPHVHQVPSKPSHMPWWCRSWHTLVH